MRLHNECFISCAVVQMALGFGNGEGTVMYNI